MTKAVPTGSTLLDFVRETESAQSVYRDISAAYAEWLSAVKDM